MLYFAYGRTQRKESRERHCALDYHGCPGRSRDLLVPKAEVIFCELVHSVAKIVVCATEPGLPCTFKSYQAA